MDDKSDEAHSNSISSIVYQLAESTMPAHDSPAVIVARFLRVNHYSDVNEQILPDTDSSRSTLTKRTDA